MKEPTNNEIDKIAYKMSNLYSDNVESSLSYEDGFVAGIKWYKNQLIQINPQLTEAIQIICE